MEKISNIFWTQDHQWGNFVKKVIFPLEKMKILIHFRKIWKKKFGLTRNGGEGGVQNMEKYFFAFLDELGHWETKKIFILMENQGQIGNFPLKTFVIINALPYLSNSPYFEKVQLLLFNKEKSFNE